MPFIVAIGNKAKPYPPGEHFNAGRGRERYVSTIQGTEEWHNKRLARSHPPGTIIPIDFGLSVVTVDEKDPRYTDLLKRAT